MDKKYKYILEFVGQTSQLQKEIGGLKGMLKGVGVAAAAFFSVDAIVSFGKSAIDAYDNSIKSETLLLTALKGRADVQQNLIDQATELMGKTLFDDDETVKAQSLVAAFVKEEEKIKTLIPLIQDMATAKGMDLAGAADLVTKTLAGEMNALGRYGIKVEGAAGSSERLKMITDGLTNAFEGQAEAAAKVGKGPLTILGNQIGNIMESIGGSIMTMINEAIKGTIGLINYFIDLYNESIVFRGAIEWIAVGFKQTWEAVKAGLGIIWENLKATGKLIKAIFTMDIEGIKEAWKSGFTGVVDVVKEYGKNTADNYMKAWNNTMTPQKKIEMLSVPGGEAAKAGLAAGKEFAAGIAAGSASGAATIALSNITMPGKSATSLVARSKEDIDKDIPESEKWKKELGDMNGMLDANQAKVDEWSSSLVDKAQTIAGAFQVGFNNIGQSIVGSLGLAQGGFEGFLGGMASMVTDMIAMFLAQSISAAIAAGSISAAFTGAAAIFTSPAFIAMGIAGVMSAFAAIPAFAEGGIAYGPTLGLMGEYPGASSNPEVIAPLSKLKSMIGGGSGSPIILQPSIEYTSGGFRIMLNKADKTVKKRTGK